MSIGYACLHIGSRKTKFSALRLKTATQENILSVTEKNLDALEAVLDYNIENGIKLYRISSDIIPLGSHPANKTQWWNEFEKRLAGIGRRIADSEMRVSMHPGQYTVLNSPDCDIAERAIADLEYHCRFLDALSCDDTCKIVLHVGGVYGDKKEAGERFIQRYNGLHGGIKKRLVIENDEKSYNAEDVLTIYEKTGIPVVFDIFHHELNAPQSSRSAYDWIDTCRGTWKNNDGIQKIHYSQPSSSGSAGAHSQHIKSKEFMDFYEALRNKNTDIMLETKDKNLSAVKCILLTQKELHIKSLEQEWARYKYFVLSRSLKVYNDIRELLKNKSKPDALAFYDLIDSALYAEENKGSEINAVQHIWGYISSKASETERRRFKRLIDEYTNSKISAASLKRFLFKMAQNYDSVYLINSLYFYL